MILPQLFSTSRPTYSTIIKCTKDVQEINELDWPLQSSEYTDSLKSFLGDDDFESQKTLKNLFRLKLKHHQQQMKSHNILEDRLIE